jgi:hypothetical protein
VQFDRHIYHATTRLMGLYHAQRQNASAFGESDGDGVLPPLDGRNHPLENHFMRWARHAIAVGDAAVTDALRLVGACKTTRTTGRRVADGCRPRRTRSQHVLTRR